MNTRDAIVRLTVALVRDVVRMVLTEASAPVVRTAPVKRRSRGRPFGSINGSGTTAHILTVLSDGEWHRGRELVLPGSRDSVTYTTLGNLIRQSRVVRRGKLGSYEYALSVQELNRLKVA